MENINLSPANQAYVQQNQQQVVTNPKNSNAPEQKKDGKKLLIAGAVAVATIAVASIMLYKTGKISKVVKKFEDIDFDKGVAKNKDGKLFTGVIDDVVGSKEKGTLKNVKLEYENVVIKKSAIDDKIVKEYFRDGDVLKIKKTHQTADGALKISESRFSDKKIAYLDRLREEKLPDGTERKWFNNINSFENQLRYEKLPDGTEKEWYINGQLKCEKLLDGTKKSYNMCGQLDFEYFPDGTLRSYKDGQLVHEVLPDGTECFLE